MLGNPAATRLPTSLVVVVPSRKRRCKFGRLKVDEPFPEPYFVPRTAKSAA